jgi:hypothetical protein
LIIFFKKLFTKKILFIIITLNDERMILIGEKQKMNKKKARINSIKNPETRMAVHTHTHTHVVL